MVILYSEHSCLYSPTGASEGLSSMLFHLSLRVFLEEETAASQIYHRMEGEDYSSEGKASYSRYSACFRPATFQQKFHVFLLWNPF